MKSSSKHILSATLLLIAAGAFVGHMISSSIQEAKAYICKETLVLLENAVQKECAAKWKETPLAYQFNRNPEEIGTYKEGTIYIRDTAFTLRYKIVDPTTDLYHMGQVHLVMTDSLYSQNLQKGLDSLLADKNIHTRSVVGITSTGYLYDPDQLSSDTASMKIDERQSYTVETSLKTFVYTAYLGYSWYTFWKLTPTEKMYIWLAIILLSIAGAIICLRKGQKERRFLSASAENDAQETLPDEKITWEGITMGEGCIYFLDKKARLQPQSRKILRIFINTPDHRVEKSRIKQEIWYGNYNKTNHMTSAINRVNRLFLDLECPFKIINDIDAYILIPLSSETEITNEEG